MLDELVYNLKHGARVLLKSPAFTAAAVLTLAVCLGANLTIFAVVDSILLRPLPFPEPDRLVTMFNSYPKMGLMRADASFPNYYFRRGRIDAFSSMAGIHETKAIVGEPGSTELADVARVTPEFFATLGVQPALGRTFTDEELTYQTDHSVILTDSYWRQHFNGDPAIIGRTLRMDGLTKTVVGVLPPDFRFLSSKARLFHPLSSEPADREIGRMHSSALELIARLKPGATVARAQSEIDAHDAAVGKDFADARIVAEAGYRTVVTSLRADHVSAVRPTILLLQGGVLILLLIGGVNLVNLLLVRASHRARELAIRQCLGAGRLRVVTQSMMETLWLAVAGGVLGLGIAAAGIRLLGALGAGQLPLGAQIAIDARLAAVALLGTVFIGVLAGLPMAWFSLGAHPGKALQSESRGGTSGHAAQRLRHGFIVAQIALAFVLLAGAGLLGLSLEKAMSVSPGFRSDGILAGRIALPWKGYPDKPSRLAFADRLVEAASGLPGVSAAGLVTDVPVNGENDIDVFTVPGYAPASGGPPLTHEVYFVTGRYFAAMGIPLREGRVLESEDSHREFRNCVVDEDFARTYWPKGGALGARLFRGTQQGKPSEAFTVVGIVGAVKQSGLTVTKPSQAVYFPFGQPEFPPSRFFVVARTSQTPALLGSAVQRAVRQIDPELPVYDLQSMKSRIADSLVTRRSPAILAAIFAGAALLLAGVGTYGVLAFAVAQRRREIGVRMALGALPKQVAAHFLALGLRLVAVGSVLGLFGLVVVGRLMRSLLFNVPPNHLGMLAVAAVIMTTVSLAACLLPSLRAAKVDPMEALRAE